MNAVPPDIAGGQQGRHGAEESKRSAAPLSGQGYGRNRTKKQHRKSTAN